MHPGKTSPRRASTWPPNFVSPRSINLDSENISFADYIRGQQQDSESEDSSSESEGDSEDDEDNVEVHQDGETADVSQSRDASLRDQETSAHSTEISHTSAVKSFMKGVGEKDEALHLNATKAVVTFYEREASQAGAKSKRKESDLIAIVDTRTSSGWDPEPGTPFTAWLSESKLDEKLSKPRLAGVTAEDPRNSSEEGQVSEQSPNYSRRLLYFSDLDERAIRVLSRRAPNKHRSAVADFLYHHLEFDPVLTVNVTPSKGQKLFTFHCNLPFYVLRQSQQSLRKDPRNLRASSQPSCLSRLSPEAATSQWHLYETQMSLVLFGSSDNLWTAYGARDCYFESKSTDSVKKQYRDCKRSEDRGTLWDPILGSSRLHGEALHSLKPSTVFTKDPREYFLRFLERGLHEVRRETNNLVEIMEKAAKKRPPIRSSRGRPIQSVDTFKAWNEEMLHQLTIFIVWLSNMIALWDSFEKTTIGYFGANEQSCTIENLEPSHHSNVSGAGGTPTSLEDRLENLRSGFTYLSGNLRKLKALKSRLMDENDRAVAGYYQAEGHRAGEHVQNLAMIALLFSPLTQVASMFNMQGGVLPFNLTFFSFVGSITAMAILYAVVYFVLFRRSESWACIQQAFTSREVDRAKPQHGEGASSRTTSAPVSQRLSQVEETVGRSTASLFSYLAGRRRTREDSAV